MHNCQNFKGVFALFYDIFCSLCQAHGLKPGGAAAKIGFSRGNINAWKNNGSSPRHDLLVRIADYFDVSTDYLLGKEKSTPAEDGKGAASDDIKLTHDELNMFKKFRFVVFHHPFSFFVFHRKKTRYIDYSI